MSEISQTERVSDEELDQLIWGLERYGLYPRQLAALKELREVRKAKGEPVAWLYSASFERGHVEGEMTDAPGCDMPIYAAPPAPVVPPEIEPDYEVIKSILPTANPDEYACCIAADMWNACRAAMLNAEKLNQPVSETEALPSGYLQGHQDGLEWAAQMAEANHPQTGDWLYDDPISLASAIRKGPDMPLASGNSPVTPESWKEEAEKLAEAYGSAFVIFRHGEEPVCADPTKFWFGFDPAAPKEVKGER